MPEAPANPDLAQRPGRRRLQGEPFRRRQQVRNREQGSFDSLAVRDNVNDRSKSLRLRRHECARIIDRGNYAASTATVRSTGSNATMMESGGTGVAKLAPKARTTSIRSPPPRGQLELFHQERRCGGQLQDHGRLQPLLSLQRDTGQGYIRGDVTIGNRPAPGARQSSPLQVRPPSWSRRGIGCSTDRSRAPAGADAPSLRDGTKSFHLLNRATQDALVLRRSQTSNDPTQQRLDGRRWRCDGRAAAGA